MPPVPGHLRSGDSRHDGLGRAATLSLLALVLSLLAQYSRASKLRLLFPIMKIEGLVGCYQKTKGLFYFARMCSKIRLHAAGKLPSDYDSMLGLGFDGRTCRYLGVTYDDVKKLVLSGKSDEEVLEWCQVNGRRLTAEQILIYNSFMSKRGWRDDETDGFIPEMIKEYGLRDDGSVLTDFDLIEMDEGRWYPEMWRDAWK